MATIRRLRRRPDFLAAAAGRRFHTERLTAQGRLRAPDETREGACAEGLHVGLTITKRVGHATERNRIRRRLRSALDALADTLPSRDADIVLIARRPALDAPYETLLDDLRRAIPAVAKPKGTRSSPDRGEGASGVRRGSGAHVPRRSSPDEQAGEDHSRYAGESAGAAPGTNTAHGSSDG